MLHIYNTLSREKERFESITPNQVNMYVCGMTVYDYCHLGHARVLVVFDMVYRYLQTKGYKVNYIRNITDIDDKIIRRAEENGEAISTLTERYIQAMHEDADALGVLRPVAEPKATDNIPAIIKMIEELISKGYAYQAAGGDVYFSVNKFDGYGKLSGKDRESLLAGARVEVDHNKRDPLDFVLWKQAKPDEPHWSSPWGDGRPGWHIECSAMSTEHLGAYFDIHGGGQDLQFPHHENEIAQSEACTGQTYVKYWMHNGFVRVNEEKMSKSLGNFFTLREILKHYDPEEVRFLILNSHYRSALNYSEQQLLSARAALRRLYTALRDSAIVEPDETFGAQYKDGFYGAMDDDFNTPEALASLFELSREVNRLRDKDPKAAGLTAGLLKQLGGMLGLLQRNPENALKASSDSSDLDEEHIQKLIEERQSARESKDWSESDRIRDVLLEQGIILEDSASGTTWRRQ